MSSARSNAVMNLGLWAVAVLVLGGIAFMHWFSGQHMGRPAAWSGYSLFALFLLLAGFNLRKRLSMLPLGRAYWWHQVHVIGGLLAIALYALHVGVPWPAPGYERWIAALVYLVFASGLLGFALQSVFPVRLTEGDQEIILERVPAAVSEMRTEVLGLVTEATERFESETLFRFYAESLDWYFHRPRFRVNHLIGGRLAGHWLSTRFQALRRYCSEEEKEYIARIENIAYKKARVDRQFAHQVIMKGWLLVHVPVVAGLMILVFWHLLLVNIYAL